MPTASLQRDKTPHDECPDYNMNPFDSEASVLEFWGMWSTHPLPLLPGPLWLWVLVHVRVPFMGQIKLLNYFVLCKQMINVEQNY